MANSVKFAQHIYTSSKAKRGYHTLRISPSLKDVIRELEQNGLYKSPSGGSFPTRPSEEDLGQFPIQFTMYTLSDGRLAFCRSLNRGRDNHSRSPRFGNYYAHTIVLDSKFPKEGIVAYEILKEFKWKDKLNRDNDQLGHQEVEDVISVAGFKLNKEPSDYLEKTQFLLEGNRLNIFLKIIDLLISNEIPSNKKIIIQDEADNLPEWMCSICLAFPPYLLKELSFSSYHYNPLNCHSKIVGVVEESNIDEENLKAEGHQVFNSNNSYEFKYKNLYVSEIKGIIEKNSIDGNQTKRLKNFFDDIKNQEITTISKDLNKPLEYHIAIHRIKDGKNLEGKILKVEDLKNFIIKYPKKKPQLLKTTASYQPTIYFDYLKQLLYIYSQSEFKKLYKWISIDEKFREEYLEKFCEIYIKNAPIKDEAALFIIENYKNLISLEKRKELIQLIFKSIYYENLTNEYIQKTINTLKKSDKEAYSEIKSDKEIFLKLNTRKLLLDLEESVLKAKEDDQIKKLEIVTILKILSNNMIQTLKEIHTQNQEDAKKILNIITSKISDLNFDFEEDIIPNEEFIKNLALFIEDKNILQIEKQQIKDRLNIDINFLKVFWAIEKEENILNYATQIDLINEIDLINSLFGYIGETTLKPLLHKIFDATLNQTSESRFISKLNTFLSKYAKSLTEDILIEFLKKGIEKFTSKELPYRILEIRTLENNEKVITYLCEKSLPLLNDNNFKEQTQLLQILSEYKTQYQLANITLPILEYKEQIGDLKFYDKREVYQKLSETVKENRIKGELSDKEIVENALIGVIRKRFNQEDWLIILQLLLNDDKNNTRDVVFSIIDFIIAYSRLLGNKQNIPTQRWLFEQFIIAVILIEDEKFYKYFIESPEIKQRIFDPFKEQEQGILNRFSWKNSVNLIYKFVQEQTNAKQKLNRLKKFVDKSGFSKLVPFNH